MLYRVSLEFRLTRRIPWDGDVGCFYAHCEAVRAKLEAHELVTEARAITDLVDSTLTFDFVVEATHYHVAAENARVIARDAIEGCGGRHFGLNPNRGGMLVSAGARPGLETPIWQHRRTLIDIAA